RRVDTGPKPKNVHGVVQDLRGKPLVGARVFVRDLKTNVVRTLTTDQDGLYKIYALPPTVDYEISAEFKGKASEKRVLSSFLNREDNVVNFQLDVTVVDGGGREPDDAGPEFRTYDLVELHASFDMPIGVPAPIPSVLLLHGYGEDRLVWKDFTRQLLNRGWALIVVADEAEGNRIKALVTPPPRVLVVPLSGGAAPWVADKRVADAVFQWLKETF